MHTRAFLILISSFLSGGLDSTTVATHAVRQGHDVRALSIGYGQRHIRELRSARAVAERLGIPLLEVDAAYYARLASFSSLTSDAMAVPENRNFAEMAQDIPNTYVPLRNTFFVTLAAAALESWLLDRIEREGEDPAALEGAIFLGANAVDYSGCPDCPPEFYDAITEVIRIGSKVGTAYERPNPHRSADHHDVEGRNRRLWHRNRRPAACRSSTRARRTRATPAARR